MTDNVNAEQPSEEFSDMQIWHPSHVAEMQVIDQEIHGGWFVEGKIIVNYLDMKQHEVKRRIRWNRRSVWNSFDTKLKTLFAVVLKEIAPDKMAFRIIIIDLYIYNIYIIFEIPWCNMVITIQYSACTETVCISQSQSAKIVTGTRKHDSSPEALRSLHWRLPIHLLKQCKVLKLVFISLHGLATKYLCELVYVISPSRFGLRSKNKATILNVPFTECNTFAEKGFSVHSPKAWNDLPDYLRSTTDYILFRKKLKIHMCDQR